MRNPALRDLRNLPPAVGAMLSDMSKFWQRLLSLGFALIVIAGMLGLVFVVPMLTTEIDPNLARPQCPGGKDSDLPAVPVAME